jgi:hypothetical protein
MMQKFLSGTSEFPKHFLLASMYVEVMKTNILEVTTNFPGQLAEAVVSRFDLRMYVGHNSVSVQLGIMQRFKEVSQLPLTFFDLSLGLMCPVWYHQPPL